MLKQYEKIDGTNIRIYWDGHKVSFHGRTNNSQIPVHLTNRLIELFGGNVNEEMFEQKFGEMEVELFGEGYGAKIQTGGNYLGDGSSWDTSQHMKDIKATEKLSKKNNKIRRGCGIMQFSILVGKRWCKWRTNLAFLILCTQNIK